MKTLALGLMIAASVGFLSAAAVATTAPPNPELVKWAAGYGYHLRADGKGNEVFCTTMGRTGSPFARVVCAPEGLMALCFQNKKKPIFGQSGFISFNAWEETCHA